MTTGTVTHYDSARRLGTLTCRSGATFPFASRVALVPGETVRFRAVGGIAGTYAVDVAPARTSRTARRSGQARRPVWHGLRLAARRRMAA